MGVVRLLLALAVVLGHSTPIPGISLVEGPVAVRAFFVISGFYMALVLNEKYERGAKGYGVFLSSRLLRLYPVYWVVIVLTIAMPAGHLVDGSQPPDLRHWYGGGFSPLSLAFMVATQVLIFGQDLVMYMGVAPASSSLFWTSNFARVPVPAWHFLLIPQAWSLGVELWFYLLAPLIVRRRVRVILIIMAASVAIRVLLSRGLGYTADPWSYRFFPSELSTFLLGALGYHAYAECRRRNFPLARVGRAALPMLVLALTLLPRLRIPIGLPIVVATGLAIPAIFSLTMSNRFDRFIGDLSYPVYLSHVLVAGLMARFTHVTGIKLAIATIVLSILMLVAVDRPVDKLRQRFVNRRKQKRIETAETVELIAAP